MKKALLVKPKDNYAYAVVPNLGLGYLASALRQAGFEAEILDCNKELFEAEQFRISLINSKFHLVGFQVYTNSLQSANEMIRLARNTLPEAIILIGGPHPSGDAGHALGYFPQADCAVVGEGEEAIVELMRLSKQEVNNRAILPKIKNVAFRDDAGNVVVNDLRFMDDLDQLAMPAWDLIDPRSYRVSPHGTFSRAYPVAPIITSRGCPYPCTFCAGFKTTGRKIRRRSIENILDEVAYLYREYGVREFHIEDDNFTLAKAYVLEFTRGLRRRGLKVWWACPNGVRADKLDEEMLVEMERSGCYSFGMGIESGSNRVLKMMRKDLTVEEIEEKVKLIKKSTRINITGFFLIGYPQEQEEDILQTLRFSRRLLLDKASFSPVMPLPGSELYSIWKRRINADALDWSKFLYYQVIPFVSDIDIAKLNKLIKKAVLGFYLRPRIIFGMLKEIKTMHQFGVILKRAKTILFGANTSDRK